jgi:hypothetical protein
MSLCWLSLYWVSLCWVPLCWMSLCWIPLCWMSLCWVSLCWVSQRPDSYLTALARPRTSSWPETVTHRQTARQAKTTKNFIDIFSSILNFHQLVNFIKSSIRNRQNRKIDFFAIALAQTNCFGRNPVESLESRIKWNFEYKNNYSMLSPLSNGGILLGMNYSVLNMTKQNEWWPNTKYFSLVNYLFNTGNICSKIGQIVTDFWWIFQQLNK